ncbi:MAG: hypothetical protein K2X86_17995 [Cytophagaceae bacterium]|nr:hypothetical protein [Cytophagaceae bacterium]
MDTKKLNAAVTALIEKKNQLSKLSYDNNEYDDIEEEVHDLEDDIMDNYGDFLEEALEAVHEKICPDNDVLMPIAYMAHKYNKIGQNPDGSSIYDVEPKEGVWVDVDKYDGKDTRLVFVPNPLRLVLVIDGKNKEVVWQTK